jgi:murein DD-endopeptidase MepM/ murein hydrolase activator NlpD
VTTTPRSRREARLASGPAASEADADAATTDAPTAVASSPSVPSDPATVSTGRRARRASSETISAPAEEYASTDAPTAPAASPAPAPASAAARASAAAVSRRAARAAAAAAAATAPAEPTATESQLPQRDATTPDAVAASSVAILRPHAQKAGRRAAESFSDEIEKPAGGRRAIVSSPTTALPAAETETPTAWTSTSPASEPAAPIDIEVVVAEVLDDADALPTSAAARATPIIETAALPIIETPAAIPPAAMAADEVVPAKPVSRRTLRTAAIAPTGSPGAAPNDPAHASPSSASGKNAGSGAGTGAGRADDAKPPTGRRRRNIAKGGFSALALVFATGIAVATTMPAEALHAAAEGTHTSILATERAAEPALPGQELTTSAEAAGASIARDGYSVRDVAALQAAGFRVADTFTNNPTGAVQWPFPVGVPISDWFGARESPGGIGSTDHKGVDFAPGQGTPIQSIADGVVSSVQPYDNSGLGVHVIIDHVVDGQKVSSVYGHMLTGSIQVTEGQVVKVAQTVGLVGNTGASTGPHLHLEIRLDGVTPVDPYAWLQTHAV